MKLNKTLLLPLLCTMNAMASEPADYYSSCENKGGRNLLSALQQKIGPHTTVSYDALLDLYKTSDVYPDGKIWDMYSTKHWSTGSKCGSYKLVGDCYNREHSMPKSWFNDAKPMYSDAFHLYPTDGKVNGQRSNHPYGECANGTRLPSNGGVQALGKLGNCTFPGYSGTVFEPDDQYKGDFARSYFYMAAAYNDRIASWSSPMLAGNSYPVFTSWSVDLLLKWHRQDPVSEKERDRQEAVYARQRNRNPFIDHPEMVEYIWGNQKDALWSYNISSVPEINMPVDGSTIDMGTTAIKYPRQTSVTVRASNLKSPISVSCSGDFTSSVSSIPANAACATAGYSFTVSFNASAAGSASGYLTLKSGDALSTIQLKAEAVDGLPADKPSEINDCGFTATWTNIGDAFANGCYRLWVLYAGTEDAAAGYPKDIDAAAERYEADDLQASTSYTYYLQSQTMRSRTYDFTTSDPIPSVDFYYDGDLYLSAMPGEPGESAELEAEIENITGDIKLTVAAPFQISTDHSNWSTEAIMPEGADRIYVRIYGDTPGEYTSSLVVRAENYFNDNTVISGSIGSVTNFHEDFEPEGTGSYNKHSYQGSACLWNFSDAGMWNGDAAHGGERAVRLGKNGSGIVEMAEDANGGIGTVSLWARSFKTASGEARFKLEYSTDGGLTWESAGEAGAKTTQYEEFHFTVNQPGKVRLRIRQTYGDRWYLDDITASTYRSNSVDDIDGYHSWDAWSYNGNLTIQLTEAADVLVYGADGIVYVNTPATSGEHSYSLESGLYLVAVNGRVRRVAVR
ncbi:MAG: endonuclease [Muribaculaceae bacterium]|nr:endonuclease [Muribaculaceae bacterium]